MSSNFHPDGTLFIVSGPSGAGKTTLINRVREQLEPIGITLYFSVSHTTRKPRDGRDRRQQLPLRADRAFRAMVERGEFIEWAYVHDQRYGTSKAEVLDAARTAARTSSSTSITRAPGRSPTIPSSKPRSLNIFIFPPSFDHLEQRLRDRGLNTRRRDPDAAAEGGRRDRRRQRVLRLHHHQR